jgi:phytol kinase
MNEAVYTLIFLFSFLLLVAFAHCLYHYFHLPGETSRKFLHVSGGLLALAAPLFIHSHWWILLLCSAAFAFLLFTFLKSYLPSVHRTQRRSIGSVLFPIPVYICFLAAQKMEYSLLFYLPVSYLTLSDSVAQWGGVRWGGKTRQFMKKQKSAAGSISFALCSLLIGAAWSMAFHIALPRAIILCLVTTLVATVAELFSLRGLDNLTVPLSTLLCLLALQQWLQSE